MLFFTKNIPISFLANTQNFNQLIVKLKSLNVMDVAKIYPKNESWIFENTFRPVIYVYNQNVCKYLLLYYLFFNAYVIGIVIHTEHSF